MGIKLRALAIDGSQQFWASVHAAVATDSVAAFSDNGVVFIALNDKARMVPSFVANTSPGNASSTSPSVTTSSVTIHGDFYGLSADALTDTKTPMRSGSRIFNRRPAGRQTTDNFSIGNYWQGVNATSNTPFQFFSDKPAQRADTTLSNCRPVIIDSIAFGPLINGINTPHAGLMLSPLANTLQTQHSHIPNNPIHSRPNQLGRAIQTPPYSGNTLIAHSGKQNILFIISLPHPSPGKTLWDIRDKLKRAQCENAVLLAASNASHLQVNGDYILAGDERPQPQQICISFLTKQSIQAAA